MKYFVTFSIPAAAIQEWMANVDETTRKEQTDKMMQDWNTLGATYRQGIAARKN
jgi:hypothetical protein